MTVNARQKLLHSFTIDYLSDADDIRYKGSFTSKKLTIRDLAALGVRKAQLNGGMHHDMENPGRGVTAETDDFNNMIAHLELALVEVPKWWDLDKIVDLNLVALVYKEVIKFENSFLKRNRGGEDAGGASDGNSSSDVQETHAEGAARPVVGKEVSSALEP